MKIREKLEKKLLAKLKEKYPEKLNPMNIPIVIKRSEINYETIRVATGMYIGDYDEKVQGPIKEHLAQKMGLELMRRGYIKFMTGKNAVELRLYASVNVALDKQKCGGDGDEQ